MSTDVAPELFPIPYEAFLRDIEALAARIGADDWRPDLLVGVGRGGLVPATYLSHRSGIALVPIDASAGRAPFADDRLAALAERAGQGERLLLVDDINDSGGTIARIRAALADHGAPAAHVRVAVLLDNVRSGARADYHARRIDRADDKRWFVFPWEAQASDAQLLAEARAVPARLA